VRGHGEEQGHAAGEDAEESAEEDASVDLTAGRDIFYRRRIVVWRQHEAPWYYMYERIKALG
jgi:hypothetical protein